MRSIKGLLMHKPAGHSTDISICMEANFFFFRGHISWRQQKLSVCVIRCGVAETMLGVTVVAAVKAGKRRRNTGRPAATPPPSPSSGSSRLVMTLSMSHISWLQRLCQPTSLGNSHTLLETLASPWKPGGQKARLRYD